MRVSSVGWLYDNLDTVLNMAKLSAEVTHNHPEGIKGAQATAAAISLGGDSDTLGAITGSIAWTFYRFEEHDSTADMWKLQFEADEFLPDDIIRFIDEFDRLCWDTYPVLD